MQNDIPWVQLGLGAGALGAWALVKWRSGGRKKKLRALIDQGARVVDVRSSSEFGAGHFQGAVNIPLDRLRASLRRMSDKDTPIIVYCASGGRSAQAASILRESGFSAVTDAGGLSSMPS